MNAYACPQRVGPPKFEPLEPRLLLDAGGLAFQPSPIVTPALEYESNGGPANDDPAAAQALEFSYLLPKISPFDGFGPRQAAVSGSADGGGGGEAYTGSTGLGVGEFIHPGPFNLNFWDTPAPGGGGTLALQLFADLDGADKYVSLTAEKTELGDLFVEGDQTNGWWTAQVALTRRQLATLAADGKITFSLSPSPAVQDVGTAIILASLTYGGGGGGAGDFYRLDLAPGESASMALTSEDSGDLDLALFDAEGTELAAGEPGAAGVAAAIDHFAAGQGGTFYVCVSGTGDYNLIVNRNATTDLEDNGDIGSAQEVCGAEVDGRQWVVGSAGGGEGRSDTDFYAVTLAPHGFLKLEAYSPGVNGKGKAKGKTARLAARAGPTTWPSAAPTGPPATTS